MENAQNMEQTVGQQQNPILESKFDGGLLGLIGINILQFLLILFT